MSLRDTILQECANSKWIDTVYMSPCERSFCVQLIIGRKTSPAEKGFTFVKPVYSLKTEASHEAQGVVDRIRQKHPDVSANIVSYVFHPGGGWVVAYAKGGR